MRITRLIKFNWHYLCIGVTAFIVHGLIFMNDGVYWDGWLIYSFLEEKDWANLSEIFIENGLPAWAYLHWIMGYFPDVILAYHLTSFICIAVSGLLLYEIGCLSGFVSRNESLLIVLISLTYPAFQVAFELIIFPYVVSYSLFWLAIFLALLAEKRDKLTHYGLRLGALICFITSFTFNSLLVFYFGFLLLLALFVRRLQSLSLRQTLMRFLPRRLDYILLPLLYWFIKETLFPRQGLYANYNRFTFSLPKMFLRLVSFLNNGIYGQFKTALLELLNQPALWLLVLLGAWIGWRYFNEKTPTNGQSVGPYTLLAYGVLLMGLGIFPYVAVGSSPTLTGWSTRHSLLLALPVALIIVAIARLLFSEPQAKFSRLGWIFLATLLSAFGLATVSNYIDWQARWVKDRSLIMKLGQLDGVEKYSVYLVDDQYPLGGEDNYRFYEWSSMFKQVWGDETRIGFNQHYFKPSLLTDPKHTLFYTKSYNLSGLDPAGCQATLTIKQGKFDYSSFKLVARYFYFKFLSAQQMSDFLTDVTQVQVQPLPSVQALNCTQ
jgi:hypothetical protein